VVDVSIGAKSEDVVDVSIKDVILEVLIGVILPFILLSKV
jgi:hypothetical protein